MSNPVTVRIFDIVGGSLCVSAEDGQRVYDKIAPLLREGKKIVLSFEQVETLISSFLNAAIGQLYGEFPEERIRELVSVTNMDPNDLPILKRVVENAKAFFRDPKSFKQTIGQEDSDEQ